MKTSLNVSKPLRWQTPRLTFLNHSLEQITQLLSRQYDVPVKVEAPFMPNLKEVRERVHVILTLEYHYGSNKLIVTGQAA